jgi:hypothetical protein
LALSDIWLFASLKKHLDGTFLHVIEEGKLPWKDGFENIPKNSKLTDLKYLFIVIVMLN